MSLAVGDPAVRYLVVLGKVEVLEDVLRVMQRIDDAEKHRGVLEAMLAEYSEVLRSLRVYVDPGARRLLDTVKEADGSV